MMQAKIQGIPCLIDCTSIFTQKPLGPNCDSDWDCYGYSEIEFAVYDRKGYPAAWLENKITSEDRTRIEDQILRGA